ncbi:MAG: VOC family protein [Bdellovibrionales bacterium]|nr:VOC family protein [Bdellovibrionales bacterium]
MKKMSTCLWFDSQAEEAAKFYISVFKNGSIGHIARYGKEGFEFHGQPEGSVMSVEFEVNGECFMALNGGPIFKFNEAISLIVNCETQEEIDDYWQKLTADGGQEVQCGWLKDKFGLSWQITPMVLDKMMKSPDKAKTERVVKAYMQMKKFNIAALERAFEGR